MISWSDAEMSIDLSHLRRLWVIFRMRCLSLSSGRQWFLWLEEQTDTYACLGTRFNHLKLQPFS